MLSNILDICNSILGVAFIIFFSLIAFNLAIKCGILIRLGLVLIIIGYIILVYFINKQGYEVIEIYRVALLITSSGVWIIIIGWLTKTRVGKVHMRRESDWVATRLETGNEARWGRPL